MLKASVAAVLVGLLFCGSLSLFLRTKTVAALLQLLGSGCLSVVVLAHVCEALRLFPWMGWGSKHSAGHYLDLWSAVLGLALFAAGCLLHAPARRGPDR